MLTTEEVLRYALAKNKKLTVNDFKGSVVIEHADGSNYRVYRGCLETIESQHIYIVYNEHGLPMVFDTRDVKIKM